MAGPAPTIARGSAGHSLPALTHGGMSVETNKALMRPFVEFINTAEEKLSRVVHSRDFALSSSNQFSTTINLSAALAAAGRIIRKRRSSGNTAYWG